MTKEEEVGVIVEVIGGAEEHPEARVVDIDNLTALHLALGEVTDEEAAEVLERAGLGRFHDVGHGVPRRRGAAGGRRTAATAPDWATRWDAMIANARTRAGCRRTARASRCTSRAPPAPDPIPHVRSRRDPSVQEPGVKSLPPGHCGDSKDTPGCRGAYDQRHGIGS